MGGYGSGKIDENSKKTTGFFFKLDARHLQRINLLQPSFSCTVSSPDQNSSISVNVKGDLLEIHIYSLSPAEKKLNVIEDIEITWTSCNLGGKRAWFLCPACDKRVAILYLNKVIACRHCQQLVYPSQRLNSENRAFKRADHIREQLGWKPGIAYGQGEKPKGMHWCTFWKIISEYNALIDIILKNSVSKMDSINDMLGEIKI